MFRAAFLVSNYEPSALLRVTCRVSSRLIRVTRFVPSHLHALFQIIYLSRVTFLVPKRLIRVIHLNRVISVVRYVPSRSLRSQSDPSHTLGSKSSALFLVVFIERLLESAVVLKMPDSEWLCPSHMLRVTRLAASHVPVSVKSPAFADSLTFLESIDPSHPFSCETNVLIRVACLKRPYLL